MRILKANVHWFLWIGWKVCKYFLCHTKKKYHGINCHTIPLNPNIYSPSPCSQLKHLLLHRYSPV